MSENKKPWHRRFRWSDWSLNGLTYALVIVNLLPIIWMVYCGFRDNNEILSGAVAPGHRRYDVVLTSPYDEGVLAGTQVGSVSLLDTQVMKVLNLRLKVPVLSMARLILFRKATAITTFCQAYMLNINWLTILYLEPPIPQPLCVQHLTSWRQGLRLMVMKLPLVIQVWIL
jgi:hypothetical protein